MTIFRWLRAALLLFAAGLGLVSPARAHDPNLSGIVIRLDESGAKISVTAAAQRLGKSDPIGDLKRRLVLTLDNKPFAPKGDGGFVVDGSGLAAAQFSEPRVSESIHVSQRLFADDPNARTAVTVFSDGKLIGEALLDSSAPSISLAVGTGEVNRLDVVLRYIREGLLHIFLGFDHVCFVVALVLAGGTLRHLLKVVTAFTLAHSITLSLAALGLVAPSPRLIEPLIAASIVVVAAENLWRLRRKSVAGTVDKPARDFRPWLAFGFGLVHGFGFAGALSEVGLPKEALVPALASFNVGVEIGQATVVLCLVPVLALLLAKAPKLHRGFVALGSIGIAAAGLFWLIERLHA